MSRIDATTQAVLIQSVFFTLSLAGAWIVLVLLRGTAKIRHKGAQFGGAAAMFVAMFILLNRYVPEMRDGIIAEARASQSQKVVALDQAGTQETLDVYLTPDRQKISLRDLRDLDKNKYYIEDQLGIALPRSSTNNWSVSVVDKFEQLSPADLPLFGFVFSQMASISKPNETARTFAVRSSNPNKIIVTRDSEIANFPVTMNPYTDREFVNRLMESTIDSLMPAEINDAEQKKVFVDIMIAETSKRLIDFFEKYIDKNIPIERNIQSGVYVTSIEVAKLQTGSLLDKFSQPMSNLDRAVNVLTLKGLMTGGGRNLKIDQQKKVASFDGSFRLRGVMLNGTKADATINHVGFIVVGESRAVFVQLISLDVDGLSISLTLKKIMDSLLFVT